MARVFEKADILIPNGCDLTKWSVVACDQFTSDPAYWDALDAEIGDAPSALRLILPEAYLPEADLDREAARINAAMEEYQSRGLFRVLPESYVYVERRQRNGVLRRGLLGVLDLEAYDYHADSASPVRATEGTVESRLPARIRVRAGASLELPHVMVFYDDPEDRIMGSLSKRKAALEALYDFDLIAGGGRLRGWRVHGAEAERVDADMDALCAARTEAAEREQRPAVLYAMGDGNHSLATAKACWEQMKQSLTPEERETHPARRSLVELVNIHDPAIVFEPIHRAVRIGDPAAFLRMAKSFFSERYCPEGEGYPLRLASQAGTETLRVKTGSVAELIAETDALIAEYLERSGGAVDYIHNDETALDLAQSGWVSLLLPKLDKTELFPTVARRGPYPRKSFSIGRAEDKRYYLEARNIK